MHNSLYIYVYYVWIMNNIVCIDQLICWIIAYPDGEKYKNTRPEFLLKQLYLFLQAAIREQQHVLRGVQQRKGA